MRTGGLNRAFGYLKEREGGRASSFALQQTQCVCKSDAHCVRHIPGGATAMILGVAAAGRYVKVGWDTPRVTTVRDPAPPSPGRM